MRHVSVVNSADATSKLERFFCQQTISIGESIAGALVPTLIHTETEATTIYQVTLACEAARPASIIVFHPLGQRFLPCPSEGRKVRVART